MSEQERANREAEAEEAIHRAGGDPAALEADLGAHAGYPPPPPEPEEPEEPETFWNGRPCKAERVKVVVGDSGRFRSYWARTQGLVGTVRNAVRVELEAGAPGVNDGADSVASTFYIDDEHGGGWAKVTVGKGAPSFTHQSLDVERELTADEDPEQKIRDAIKRRPDLEPLGEGDYVTVRRGIFGVAQASAVMPLEMIDRAILTAELAIEARPLTGDVPFAQGEAAGGLDLELKMFRSFRAFVARLAALRPEAEQRAAELHDRAQGAAGNGEPAASSIIVPHYSTRQEDPKA